MTSPTEVNPNYTVRFLSRVDGGFDPEGWKNGAPGASGSDLEVVAHTPDALNLSMSNQFTAPKYGGMIEQLGGLFGAPGQAIAHGLSQLWSSVQGMAGVQLGYFQTMSAFMWQGMDNRSTFSVRLQFNTETNPVTDVMLPFLRLVKMAVASEPRPGVLVLPQPSILTEMARAAKNSGSQLADDTSNAVRRTSFSYGQAFVVEPIVITQIALRIMPAFDYRGVPMSLDVAVGFAPFYTPIAENFDGTSMNPLVYYFRHTDGLLGGAARQGGALTIPSAPATGGSITPMDTGG